jgi:hypothetical protein
MTICVCSIGESAAPQCGGAQERISGRSLAGAWPRVRLTRSRCPPVRGGGQHPRPPMHNSIPENMTTACRVVHEIAQLFPTSGPIRLDCGLAELRRLCPRTPGAGGDCYAYVVDAIQINRTGHSCQEGSGPNWQGGRITLCTCKHWMRSFRDPQGWEGCWIAGFTSRKRDGYHWLVYLMQVKHAFASHAELWRSGKLSARTLAAKAASSCRLGDLFEPVDHYGKRFLWKFYRPPATNHSHAEERWPDQWHKDIYYRGASGRRPPLLVGDPTHSFLWSRRRIRCAGELARGQKRVELAKFLNTQMKEGRI